MRKLLISLTTFVALVNISLLAGVGLTLPGTTALARVEEAKEEHQVSLSQLGKPTQYSTVEDVTEPIYVALTPTSNQPVEAKEEFLPIVDQPGITLKHKQIATEVFNLLPAGCAEKLETFHVVYDDPKYRGLGGKSTIIVSGQLPDNEFRAVLIHESAHLLDLGCIKGNAQSGASDFLDGKDIMYNDDPSVVFYSISWASAHQRQIKHKRTDFFTGYALSDAYEDFAEHYTAYVTQRKLFERVAKRNSKVKAKLNWFKTYLPDLPLVAEGKHIWTGQPWDATKLEFEWLT